MLRYLCSESLSYYLWEIFNYWSWVGRDLVAQLTTISHKNFQNIDNEAFFIPNNSNFKNKIYVEI